MSNDEKPGRVPPDLLEMAIRYDESIKRYDESIKVRNQLTIGVLLHSISEEHLGDRQATIEELLRIADVGVDLFYAVIAHRDFTPEVLEEARAYWGPLVDVARQMCGLGPAVI
jgi:hypothetical protein